MKNQFKHILQLNLALLLIATAAPFGSYISLPPAISIWSRCFVAFMVIGIFIKLKNIDLKFNVPKDGGSFLLCAVLQAGHWVAYFYALQLAGAGLGIIALFTFPIFTTLLEPILLKTTFNAKHLLLALLVILGLYVLTPEFSIGNQTTLGIFYGIASALFYAIRNILMKKHVTHYNAMMLMFYQTGLIVVLLIPAFFIFDWSVQSYTSQIPYLLFLGIVTTALGHTTLVKSFKYFSATTASLLSCIQPLYAMILAFIFLNEVPTATTVIGGSMIILAVVLESFMTQKN